MDLVSPTMRKVVKASARLAPPQGIGASVQELRAAYCEERRFWNEGGAVMASSHDEMIQTRHGAVLLRHHRPTASQDLPVVLYIHGGGWVLGCLDTHDRIMRSLAAEAGAVVVGIDYSLSPEARFPVAIEQCVDAIKELVAAGHRPIALAGDSAGATMALAATLALREEAGVDAVGLVSGLLLYYGMYGLRDSTSRRLFGGPWDGMSADDLAYYEGSYLTCPEEVSSPLVDLLSADLTHGIPPCHLVAAQFDPLRDDSHALAAILQQRGVRCSLRESPGVLHGFLHYARLLPEARTALASGAAFLTDLFNSDKPSSHNT
ncbi:MULTISPECIES: alpha/beta hydrolase fold domain-containing protein [unclassified Luteococcus]|uniref:alpha/beta hydrolase fold domain-containing protein n=1 Tax=unclassified Luteococcus TaxID=2639923 RepID=UPI00313D1546